MNKIAWIGITVIVAALVSFGTVKFMERKYDFGANIGSRSAQQVHFANDRVIADVPEFAYAASLVTQSIVHIKVRLNKSSSNQGQYGPYYGSPQPPATVMSSGSGVIFSKNGFIITNNHVVEGASDIEVILTDKRIFPAKLIGRDPNTDLAVIQINTNDLTPIQLGNSDNVQVGQWVLAAGYPFSLNTTVTAGIVSAKERSIGIIGLSEDRQRNSSGSTSTMSSAVEAFIQTDAAINPGNSGGALVNTEGKLIGINAAISSHTGSYVGYGFAIPVNLTSKIVNDLIKYGTVKRGLLGVSFPAPSTEDQFLIQQGIKPGSIQGAYITGVQDGSAAGLAGLKPGDIIQGIDDAKITSSVQLSERIARHYPGDELRLRLKRGDQIIETKVTLKDIEVSPDLNNDANIAELASKLGAEFAPLNNAFKQHYQINTGLAVISVKPGGLFAEIGIQRGSVILSINGNRVNSVATMINLFNAANNGIVRFECITTDGSRIVFNISLGA